MSILLLQIFLFVLTVFLYLFLFWRRLKEDYLSEPIFSSGFIILFTTLLGGFSFSLLPYEHLWFWGAGIGFFLSTQIVSKRYKYRFFELYEAASRAILVLLAHSFLVDWLLNAYLYSLCGFIFLVALFLVFELLEKNYRKFTWYKSGKVGFSGLAVIGILFLIRALLGMFEIPVISLVGRVEFVLSGIASFLHFFFVYHLSES